MRQRMSGVFNGRIALSDLQILGTTRLDPIVHDLSASEDVLEQSARVHDQLVRIQAKYRVRSSPMDRDLCLQIYRQRHRVHYSASDSASQRSLVLQKNLGDGCIVRTEPTPLRFYRDTPIISLVTEAELEVLSCPETQAAPLENTPRKANAVVISELMPRPSSGLSTTDQWFELFQYTNRPCESSRLSHPAWRGGHAHTHSRIHAHCTSRIPLGQNKRGRRYFAKRWRDSAVVQYDWFRPNR